MISLTTKQFGDACEYAALAELNFAGYASTKMPDNWPGYDLLVAARPDGRISVKGLRQNDRTGSARFWNADLGDAWDWLVLVWIGRDGKREFYVVPRAWVAALHGIGGQSSSKTAIHRSTVGLEVFRDNFKLDAMAAEIERQRAARVEHYEGRVIHPEYRGWRVPRPSAQP